MRALRASRACLQRDQSMCRNAAMVRRKATVASTPVAQWPETRDKMPSKVSPNTAGLPRDTSFGNKRFADFDLAGKVYIVTGGARGLGLALAETLVEAGGKGT